MLIHKTLLAVALGAVVFVYSVSSIAADTEPYIRIIALHRMVVTSRASIVEKSAKWQEPYRTELLNEFTEKNLTNIYLELLKSYFDQQEAELLANFLESPVGQKLVQYSHGEYDLNQLSLSEERKLASFGKSKAGMAYERFAREGMRIEYPQIIRDRAKATIERIQKLE